MLFLPEFPWSDLHTLNLDWLLSVVANHERQLQDFEGSASPYDGAPLADGAGDPGTVNQYARGDHRHPTDSTRASVTALQAVQDSVPGPSNGSPRMDGTANPGTYTYYSRADHVHPSDTSKLDKTGGEVNGLLDIVPRRCYRQLSSPGWYRVMNVNAGSANPSKFSIATIVDIKIGTEYLANNNGTHEISLQGVFNNPAFVGEESRSNYMLVDKVRYTYDSSGNGHIDIHYIGTSGNPVWCTFTVHTPHTYQHWFVADTLTDVAVSPSNETVLKEYSFAENTRTQLPITHISNSYANSDAIARLSCWRRGETIVCSFNLGLSTAMPTGTDFVRIGSIALPRNLVTDFYATIPAQNGGGTLLVQIAANGDISIANASGAAASGFYRSTLTFLMN